MNELIISILLHVAGKTRAFVADFGSNFKKSLRKNNVWASIVLLSGLIYVIGCSPESRTENIKILVDIKDAIDTANVQAAPGVKISIMKTDNGNAVKMECGNNNLVPSVIFKEGKDKWVLSNYKYVAVDITNPGKEDLFVESQLAGNAWYSGGQNIRAGKTRTIRACIQRIDEYPAYLDKKFIGMDALPGGIIKAFWWTAMHPDSIHDLSVVIINPSPNTSILISNIRGEGSITPPS